MLAPSKNQNFRPRLEADGTITRLPPDAPDPALPTWEEYLASDKEGRHRISLLWCRTGHRYVGDGSQTKEAMDLYIRECNFRRANGEVRPAMRRAFAYSTDPLDDDRAIIISEHEQFCHDAAYDAARDAEGHR